MGGSSSSSKKEEATDASPDDVQTVNMEASTKATQVTAGADDDTQQPRLASTAPAGFGNAPGRGFDSALESVPEDDFSKTAPARPLPTRHSIANNAEMTARELKDTIFFDRWDRDRSGLLDKEEVKKMAEGMLREYTPAMGHLTDDEVELIMRCGGTTAKTEITYEQLPLAIAIVRQIKEHNDVLITLFRKHDRNGNGRLEVRELRNLLKETNRGIAPNESDMKFILRQCEPRGRMDPIPIEELRAALASWYVLLTKPSVPDKIKDMFSFYDYNGNGSMDKRELRNMLTALDPKLKAFDNHQWDQLLQKADRNNDGQIDYHEFIDWLMAGKPPPANKFDATFGDGRGV